MPGDNETLVLRFFDEMCNARKLDVANEILTDDHEYVDPHSPPADRGPDGMKAIVRVYQDDLDGHWHVEETIPAGDRVTVRWTGTGTHNSDLMGFPATGKPIRVDAISVFRIENARIAQHICLWDTLSLLQQIGAVPEPA
jgi:steroid delta-isomerase-like uncharacterized protein